MGTLVCMYEDSPVPPVPSSLIPGPLNEARPSYRSLFDEGGRPRRVVGVQLSGPDPNVQVRLVLRRFGP